MLERRREPGIVGQSEEKDEGVIKGTGEKPARGEKEPKRETGARF